MTGQQFAALCVPACRTLREALTALDETARGVLLVVGPDGRLRRTLTDGDMRRAALAHVSETTCISELSGNPPLTLGQDAGPAAALALMDQHLIDHLPVVDRDGRPVDIILRREITQRIWLSSPHLGEWPVRAFSRELPSDIDGWTGSG